VSKKTLLPPRWLVRLRRGKVYTTRTLAMGSQGPPWHRGLVAVATMVLALLFARSTGFALATVVGPALAFFLTMADIEGALATRLSMLAWSAGWVAVSGVVSISLSEDTAPFAVAFAAFAFVAGLGAWAGAPFLQATRYAVIVGLLLTNARGISAMQFTVLLAAAGVISGLLRSIEHVLSPDPKVGEFASLRQALFKIRAARPLLWRYAITYTAVAGLAWALGKVVDEVHPTWLTVSTLVVMWPDAARSYQRILQRVFGTIAGALAAVGLIDVIANPFVLTLIALSMVFFLPHFIRRNYWLHSGLVVIFVLVALDVSSDTGFSGHVVTERISDVLLGCVFGMLGTLIAFGPAHRRALEAARHGHT
jgi:hypothetical protein